MNICMVSELYPPEVVGGAEKHVRTISEKLADRGHEVTVLTTGNSDQYNHFFSHEMRNDVRIERIVPLNMYSPIEHPEQPIWKKPIQHIVDLWNPHMFGAIRQKIEEINPDIIHTHNFSGFSPSVFRAAKNYPICHTLHDYSLLHVLPNMYIWGDIREFPRLMAPLRQWNQIHVEPYINTVMAPSNFLLKKHHSYGLFTDTRSVTLRLGIDSTQAYAEPKKMSSDEFRLLFVGNISEKKGVLLLVELFDELESRGIRLDIVGKGPEKETVASAAVDKENIYVHGFVSEDELDRLYRQAHFTLVPSKWYDNSPMVIYESYAHATPVIGADIGGIPELIEPGKTGYLFSPGSPEELMKKIDRAQRASPENMRRSVMSKSRKMTISGHVDKLVNIYGLLRRD